MPTEEEIRKFVEENKDMIEELMMMEKTSIRRFAIEEKKIAEKAAGQAKDMAKRGANKAEETARGVYSAIMDPEVQSHFVNMGIEFFMGMSTLLSKMPTPEFVKDLESSIKAGINDALVDDDDCDGESPVQVKPQKVKVSGEDERRKNGSNVFKPTDSE